MLGWAPMPAMMLASMRMASSTSLKAEMDCEWTTAQGSRREVRKRDGMRVGREGNGNHWEGESKAGQGGGTCGSESERQRGQDLMW